MKSPYVIFALLGVTIGTLVLAKPGMLQAPEAQTTTAEPITISKIMNETNSTTAPPSTVPTTTIVSTTNTTPIPTTTNSTTTSTTSTTTTTTQRTTTPEPTPPKTTPSTSTATPTSTAASKTTAVPTSAPSKDRQFDGLSFFGGIILTTCLMAIAAFSWKFYRQCKEGNYRTL